MSKRRRPAQARAEPANQKRSATSWLCSQSAYEALLGGGYIRLADCPEIRTCVDVYANLISSMTLYLMQNTGKGDVRVKNGLSRMIDITPNPLMTRKTWMHDIVSTLLLYGAGNQVTVPIYGADDMISSLEPLEPSAVSIIDTPSERGYTIRYGSKVYKPDEVLHFVLCPDPNRPWVGMGYQAVLRDIVRSIRQTETTRQKIMERPAPSIIVKVDGLTEEFASPSGRKTLAEQYLSSDESAAPWFIPAETFAVEQVKPLSLNDLAIAQNMEIDKRAAASIFGMPPFLVGVGAFNASEFNHFIATRLLHVAQIIEQELTRKLLYSTELYWHFNPRSLYSYSLQEICAIGSAMVDRMAITRNELREWIGLTPRPDMDELLALENYIPADRLGDQKKLKEGGEEDA